MIRLVSAWVLVNGLVMTPVWLSGALTDNPAPAWLSIEAALMVGGMALLCAELRLIIEIDGGQHAEQIIYDLNRTKILQSKGYQVVRFWNNEVLGNIEGVLEALTPTLSQRERELSPSPLRGEGRGEGE